MFLRFGFRKTSMEGIAAEAQVSKVTLYAYFRDKAAVFDAGCAHLTDQLIAAARNAAAAAPSPAGAAKASLTEKLATMYRITASSPHAEELLSAASMRAGAMTAQRHQAYVEELSELLCRCDEGTRESAAELAEVLHRAAEGLVRKATGEEELRRQLGLLLGRVLPG